LRRLDDEVIQTVFLVAQSLRFFPGRQIIRQHEIPALDDIEHSFSSNPCSEAGIIRQKNCVVNPSTGGENEHRERAPRAITTRSPGMSATALRSATADRGPENWCRQAAHEAGVDDDPPRTESSIGGKNEVFWATEYRRCPSTWRSRANDNSPMWLNAVA
jgi:hypothetical protein